MLGPRQQFWCGPAAICGPRRRADRTRKWRPRNATLTGKQPYWLRHRRRTGGRLKSRDRPSELKRKIDDLVAALRFQNASSENSNSSMAWPMAIDVGIIKTPGIA